MGTIVIEQQLSPFKKNKEYYKGLVSINIRICNRLSCEDTWSITLWSELTHSYLSAHLTRVYLGTFPDFICSVSYYTAPGRSRLWSSIQQRSVIALLCFVTNTLKLSSLSVLIQIYVKGQNIHHYYLKNNSKCMPWHGPKRAIATGKMACFHWFINPTGRNSKYRVLSYATCNAMNF